MTAREKIENKISSGHHICVGLDSDITKIPKYLLSHSNPILEFNKIIIENTYQDAAAYKINFAFYEKDGSRGFETIHKTMELISNDVLTIADAKRGDIGNTSQMYAQSIFDHFGFDAVTLHPYMGFDSLSPFIDYKNKLNFILALTSNSGASDFEKQKLENGYFLYQHVIKKILEWNQNQNCGIVFGATNIDELKNNIESFGSIPVLLPGVGTQGGSLEEVTHAFSKLRNMNFIMNISRALIYSDSTENFGSVINKIIKQYNSAIQSILSTIK
ncbi:MAG: orotidine-5'-phosphate decarboxylase [Ignavibacteriales bacterium]|nr:orotidine-5'-phosphate decarboxylase [Ignavibacteriales bacterium]